MQEKKLKRFKIYSKIANVLFVLTVVFTVLGLLAVIGFTTYLSISDYSTADIVNKISHFAMPNTNLEIPSDSAFSYGILYAAINATASTVAGAAVIAYIIKSVANMFKYTAADQTPFTKKTVKCVKGIGIAFFVYTGLLLVVGFVAGFAMRHIQDMSTVTFQISWGPIFLGVLLLSLGEIFDFGMSLQQDSESIV